MAGARASVGKDNAFNIQHRTLNNRHYYRYTPPRQPFASFACFAVKFPAFSLLSSIALATEDHLPTARLRQAGLPAEGPAQAGRAVPGCD